MKPSCEHPDRVGDARCKDCPRRVQRVQLASSRPEGLSGLVGQRALVDQLRMVLKGAELRGARYPHCLIGGAAGHGKSTLAAIIASEIGGKLVKTSAVSIRKPMELVAILNQLEDRSVLFMDEIHRLQLSVAEMFYEALEDFTISRPVGDGEVASIALKSFVCVGATTNPGLLPRPFRDRFGYQATVEPYTEQEIAEIVHRAWLRGEVAHDLPEAAEVAKRSKLVPRLALHLADRVLDYCYVMNQLGVPPGFAARALEAFGVDRNGLDRTDWRILRALVTRFNGRPVGLKPLAEACDLDEATLEGYESGLVRSGLLLKTRTGRTATAAAFQLVKG